MVSKSGRERGPALLRRGFASPEECTDHAPAVVNALADTLGHRLIALIDQEFAVSKDGMADTHGRKFDAVLLWKIDRFGSWLKDPSPGNTPPPCVIRNGFTDSRSNQLGSCATCERALSASACASSVSLYAT